jgi:peptidoglycan/xylan/chitin deacetylase (PgdA/CDA1 family)
VRAILTYHSIDNSGSAISMTEATLRSHVKWLASGKVQVTPLEHLPRVPADTHAVAVTFDDGFQNFADVAWPLLKQHGMPVTLFVVTQRVGANNAWDGKDEPGIPTLPLMTWDTIRRLVDQGLTLGSHGRTHAHLPGLDDAALAEEVAGSADEIHRAISVRPSGFCFPFGEFDERSVALARAHYDLAVTTYLATIPNYPDVHCLPRLDAYYYRDGVGRLERWGSGSFARYVAIRRFARSVRPSWLSR